MKVVVKPVEFLVPLKDLKVSEVFIYEHKGFEQPLMKTPETFNEKGDVIECNAIMLTTGLSLKYQPGERVRKVEARIVIKGAERHMVINCATCNEKIEKEKPRKPKGESTNE